MKIGIKRILCPTDFSGSAEHALQYALAIAERHGATVELLSGAKRDRGGLRKCIG